MFIANRLKHQTCGSELARDSGGSVNINVECIAAIASKLAPTGVTGVMRFLLLAVALLLSACAGRAPLPEQNPDLPLPLQLHIQLLQPDDRQDWVLVIQREETGIRWSMMDLLGIPQARQKLIDKTWESDGFLPPNPQARELFAALLFALTPQEELAANYPGAWQYGRQRSLPERWDIRYAQPQNFELKLPHGPSYQVTPLSGETP
ncbi:hypothetical protein PSJE_21710 [Pseudomonas jessenii]|uniref:DUF3261 domain-containing protein n=2 Tax=Pseudomonas TaxID=286 RepID=A0A231G6F7_PSEJE|nr:MULTISPECIES: hypothetical protein [Pseudomonas]OXR32185.1 hypothetical protein PSJE_21710 [Pseudomonas jessenii]SEB63293.1 hypothetical protein SAMN04490187_1366 [Pseudomonas jessenii]VVQ03751.1 hypothetical protein PS922_03904 [Pseudomonas fluorescens]